jgi:transcriptional antiterminator RfaH
MIAPPKSQWFVAQTRPNSESRAARHLERQGYRVYLPRYLKRRRHARKVDFVAAALFPRYIFVGIDIATQRWRSIQSTFGVVRLVTNGELPTPVPEGIIESLQQREDERGFVEVRGGTKLSPGAKVRVVSGAFIDALGQFECMGDRDRVAILLDLLGQKVRVILDEDLVVAA